MSESMGDSNPNQYRNAKADAKASKAYAKASRPWYKKKRFWLLGLIVLAVVVTVGSSGGEDGSTDGSAGSDGSNTAARNEGPAKPDMKVEAKKILREFEENEAAADGKYGGKTLQVSGVVDKVDTEMFDDEQYVVRVGAGTDFDLITVNCNDQSAKDVASIKKGQDIVVVGRFDDGGDFGVELKDCKIA
jgi:hypothetical protein